ncbi:hypothetical protein AVEN_9966-1 [Araneus ventricosus]|uniref:Uncharacterized protein n=1 Tax=Araneus ventricosus TaxID=182803 RepID=A0A4Y2F8X1_ARAVE|nr:hypothetical protein AVEN_9966-1 [Araneus ventricosus]
MRAIAIGPRNIVPCTDDWGDTGVGTPLSMLPHHTSKKTFDSECHIHRAPCPHRRQIFVGIVLRTRNSSTSITGHQLPSY